jgi:hypothetical protein
LVELIPGRATSVEKVLDDLDRRIKQIAHEAITEGLMTLSLPGEVLSLGRDVPGTFPPDLKTIDNPDLRALLGWVDPTPDTTRGSGANDWSILRERIHFIADLFRVYQERPTLLSDPFSAEQVAVIKSGRRPPRPALNGADEQPRKLLRAAVETNIARGAGRREARRRILLDTDAGVR